MRFSLSALARVFLALVVTAQCGGAAAAGLSPAPASVLRARLANGLDVIVVRDPLAPVAATWMTYKVGSDDETVTGTAHGLEHMMFRGSRGISDTQLADTMAVLGGNFNAYTESEATQFFFEVPARFLDAALTIEASRAAGLDLSPSAWRSEQGTLAQEIRRDDSSVTYRLYVRLLHRVLAGTPYANEGLGTVTSFAQQIDTARLRRFYRSWYRPNNAVLVIVGDVDPPAALANARRLFEAIPARPVPAHAPVALQPLRASTFYDRSDEPFALAMIGYRLPGLASPDYAAARIALDVLNSDRSRLAEQVRRGDALFNVVECYPFPAASLGFLGLGVPVGHSVERAVRGAQAALAGYARDGVPAALVEAAKQREIAQTAQSYGSISGVASAWSQALAVEGRTPADDLGAIRAVRAADVTRVLRTAFDGSTASVGIARPSRGAVYHVDAGKVRDETRAAFDHHDALPAFAREAVAHPSLQPAQRPSSFRLANGLRVVVDRLPYAHSVVVRGTVQYDEARSEPASRLGVASLVGNLLGHGTALHGESEFARRADAISADLTFGNRFGLDVQPAYFEPGLALLAEGLRYPAFSPRAFELARANAAGTVAQNAHAPDTVGQGALSDALYQAGDAERVRASAGGLRSLRLADARNWYRTAYRPQATTIVVAGDVDVARVRRAFERFFGGWAPGSGAGTVAARPKTDPIPLNGARTIRVPDGSRQQAAVKMVQVLDVAAGTRRYAALQLANTLLTGGFYASQLYRDLSGERGLVYYVGSNVSAKRGRALLTIEYGCDANRVSEIQAIVARDLRAMAREPVSPARLRYAKALMLNALPVARESLELTAAQLLADAVDPSRPDEARDLRYAVEASPAQVRDAVRAAIGPERFVTLVVQPSGS